MSDYDAEMYENVSGGVRKQVKALRIILDSLQVRLSVVCRLLRFATLKRTTE